MRSALLFAAVAVLAFFITIDTPVRPEAAFHADFEPAMQVETSTNVARMERPILVA